MRPNLLILIAACVLPLGAMAQETPSADVSVDEFVQALTPKPQLMLRGGFDTRGISVEQREGTADAGIDIAVEFDYDSAKLTDNAKGLLGNLAQALLTDDLSGLRFSLGGHTDSIGSDAYNERLSLARAEAVRSFLFDQYGIALDRLDVEGFGESRPLFPDAPEDGRNRRVEVTTLE